MSWIELHDDLPNHPKITELCAELKIKKAEAVGLVCCLWTWALRYAEDGDLSKFSQETIEKAVGWTKKNLRFLSVLKGKFVDEDLKLHDWLDFVGPYLIKKYGGGGNINGRKRLKKIWWRYGLRYGSGGLKYSDKDNAKDNGEKRLQSDCLATKKRMLSDPRSDHLATLPTNHNQPLVYNKIPNEREKIASHKTGLGKTEEEMTIGALTKIEILVQKLNLSSTLRNTPSYRTAIRRVPGRVLAVLETLEEKITRGEILENPTGWVIAELKK